MLLGVPPSFAQPAGVATIAQRERVGADLYEVAVGESTGSIYVASTGSGERRIVALDPRTLTVKSSIPTEQAAYGLAFNNRTSTLYTTNTRAGTVSAIDVRSGRLKATIRERDDESAHVFRALVDEESNTIYVSLPGTPSRIWVIDGATNTLHHEILNVGGRSTGLALDRAGGRLYTCSIASSEILEIDLASRQVTRRFPSGGVGTTHLVFDAKAKRLFATHQQSGDVTVVDPASGTVLQRIPTGAGALGLDLDDRHGLLYVTNRLAGTVSVIDTARLRVVANLETGAMPNTVAVDPRTGNAYVTLKKGSQSPGSTDGDGDTVAIVRPAAAGR